MSVKKFKKGIPFYTVNNENIRDITLKTQHMDAEV